MKHKITIVTFSTTLLLSINLISAAKFTQSTSEDIYNSAYNYYIENRAALTPRVLGRLDYQLKQIITDQNTPQEVLANTAYLLFVLDCTKSYTKACNALFNRPDFNPRLYKNLIKRIHQHKMQKSSEK